MLRIASRNLGRNVRRTAIVVTAVMVGIAGTLLSMALNVGIVLQMVENAIDTELAHLEVHAADYEDAAGRRVPLPEGGTRVVEALAGQRSVVAWARRLRSEGLASSPRASAGVRVLGVEPDREPEVTRPLRAVVVGVPLGSERRRAVVGRALAERLRIGVGDKLVLSIQDRRGDLAGGAFRVAGLFETPSREFDRATVLVRLEDAQQVLLAPGEVTEVAVRVARRSDVPRVEAALEAALRPAYRADTWEELAPLLVYLVELFDSTAWMVYAAIFVAMAFGIANVLLMAVYERIREIGIMLALGMPPRRLVALIVTESMLLTGLGLVLGFALTAACLWALRDGLDMSRFAEGLTAYGVGTRVVPVVRAYDIWVPTVVAGVTAGVASLWPALHAVRLRPAEAVRHV